jgi:DNA (cytosine-5)-methyltransferase 1
MTLREFSCFTGVAGFTKGLEDAGGFEPVAFVEKDKFCRRVLHTQYPDVPITGDIHDVTPDTTKPLGRIDLVTGGFPCQGISIAGKRRGLADKRSGLWFEFHRVIMEIQPEWFIIENVDALLSSGPPGPDGKKRKGVDFAVVLAGLTGLVPRIPDGGWRSSGFMAGKYGVAWRVFDSQYFAVPQRRKRIFLVGHLGDERAIEVLFESESLRGTFAPRGRKRKGATGISEGGGEGAGPWIDGGNLPDCLTESGLVKGNNDFYRRDVLAVLDERVYDTTGITSRTNRSNPQKGDPAPTSHEGAGNMVVVGTLSSSGAGTARTGNDRQQADMLVVSNKRVRRLLPVECERLQGFPDGWTSVCSDTQRYRQMGNAVTTTVVKKIGERLVAVHRKIHGII